MEKRMKDRDVVKFADGKRKCTIKMKDDRVLIGQLKPAERVLYQFTPELKVPAGAKVAMSSPRLLEEFTAEEIEEIT